MLTTLRMPGIGIGTTSPRNPPRATKSATVVVVSRKRNGSPLSTDGLNPAALNAPDQIGICPLLSRTTSVFSPIPIAAICSPGTRQLAHSQVKMRTYAATNAQPSCRPGARSVCLTSPATISSARATPRIGVHRRRRSTSLGRPPPAKAPTMSASAMTLRNRSIVRGEQRPRRWGLLVRHGRGGLRVGCRLG